LQSADHEPIGRFSSHFIGTTSQASFGSL